MPTDSDDTGMIIAALNLGGWDTPVASLARFERENYFACFERDRGASVSANAHVLAALVSRPVAEQHHQLAGSIHKAVEFLYRQRHPDGFWLDKWHISPYYATASAGLALADHPSQAVRRRLKPTVAWVLATQQSKTGGWGQGEKGGTTATLEETAYALQFLQAVPDLVPAAQGADYEQAVRRGRAYLEQQLIALSIFGFGAAVGTEGRGKPLPLPKLWRGKELYCPIRVVLSAALGALLTPAVAAL
jgi:halimadienyl-diphosphate synthase